MRINVEHIGNLFPEGVNPWRGSSEREERKTHRQWILGYAKSLIAPMVYIEKLNKWKSCSFPPTNNITLHLIEKVSTGWEWIVCWVSAAKESREAWNLKLLLDNHGKLYQTIFYSAAPQHPLLRLFYWYGKSWGNILELIKWVSKQTFRNRHDCSSLTAS